jgi:hypothetical protein
MADSLYNGWETVWQGEVTTKETTSTGGATASSDGLNVDFNFADMVGQSVRLTVNGTVKEYPVVEYAFGEYVGEIPYEGVNDTDVYAVIIPNSDGGGMLSFYILPAGTYTVKIEKAVTTAAPIDPQSLMAGWLVGKKIVAMRGKVNSAEPVAYLYGHVAKEGETPTHTINGVGYVGEVMPKLPEWDEETYRNACIGKAAGGSQFALSMSQSPCVYNGTAVVVASPRLFCMYNKGEWRAIASGSGNMSLGSVIWANHDILNEDGTTYLAASDPVPVYE